MSTEGEPVETAPVEQSMREEAVETVESTEEKKEAVEDKKEKIEEKKEDGEDKKEAVKSTLPFEQPPPEDLSKKNQLPLEDLRKEIKDYPQCDNRTVRD